MRAVRYLPQLMLTVTLVELSVARFQQLHVNSSNLENKCTICYRLKYSKKTYRLNCYLKISFLQLQHLNGTILWKSNS